jgi:hypothetical protein
VGNLAPSPFALDPLLELQKAFCLFCFDSQLRIGVHKEITDIMAGQRAEDINMYKLADGKILMRRHLETLPVSCAPKKVTEDFLVNPNTLQYDEVAFTPATTPITTLNYWVSPGIVPVAGDWSVIREFLLFVICNGDHKLHGYLVRFLAHMWQKPEEKPGIIIVLLGGQGTGKGTLFYLLQRIWSKTTLHISDVEHVTGGFNGAMERNYIVNMDEALFSGDRRSMDRLKSMITEPSITIEQKYQPRRTIKSLHRFFAASNHDHFGNIELDDRRFVFLRVADTRQGDHDYFDRLYTAINDPVQLGAFVHKLATLDIADFNFRAKPNTGELLEQKLQSLSGFSRYWYEVLCTGYTDCAQPSGGFEIWEDSRFVSTGHLSECYKQHLSKSKQYQTVQNTAISGGLKKWCPAAVSAREIDSGRQRRGYQLPNLNDARVAFEVAIGGKIDWGDDAE